MISRVVSPYTLLFSTLEAGLEEAPNKLFSHSLHIEFSTQELH
jgi:hypothetical protein